MTDFYDEYLEAYEEESPPPPDNVATWAAKTKGAPPPISAPPSRSGSVAARPGGGYDRGYDRGYDQRYDERSRAPPSSYGGSNSTSLRRKQSRRPPRGYEDEEGYASGDFSDPPLDMARIRVKVCLVIPCARFAYLDIS